jgi:hypothetical protein
MKTRAIASDIRRALSSKGFFAGTTGMVIMIALASMENIITAVRSSNLLENGYHTHLVLVSLSSGWVTLAIPILAALPYTTTFVDEVKSGFTKQYLHRSGLKSYIKSRLIACSLSGGLALVCGIILVYMLSALVFMPMEHALVDGEIRGPYFVQLVLKIATLFFSGAFWSLVGFTLASLTMNRHMAYASPFIFYYVLIILRERYFPDFYVLYPKEWLSPSDKWVLGDAGVILLIVMLSLVVALIFAVTAEKKLIHG